MSARILQLSSADTLSLLARALQAGEVVGMPTETVYGLAGAAFNPAALARIFAAKERPTFDPLIVHVGPSGALESFSRDARSPECPLPAPKAHEALVALEALKLCDFSRFTPLARARAEALMRRFWPGPLTLVLPKNPAVPDLATSGLATVGIRMPRHPAAQALIAAAGTPLAAPSANRFGRISPTRAQDVVEELGDRIEWVLDGGSCEIGLESTVVSISAAGELTLLRPGGVSQGELENAMGAPILRATAAPGGLSSPGLLDEHYAPAKPIALLSQPLDQLDDAALAAQLDRIVTTLGQPGPSQAQNPAKTRGKLGLLALLGQKDAIQARLARLGYPPERLLVLSPSGDLAEMAQKLFAGLRELDASGATALAAEPLAHPSVGLAHAISDRLKKATHRGTTRLL